MRPSDSMSKDPMIERLQEEERSMDPRQARFGRLALLASVVSLIAAACGGATPSAAQQRGAGRFGGRQRRRHHTGARRHRRGRTHGRRQGPDPLVRRPGHRRAAGPDRRRAGRRRRRSTSRQDKITLSLEIYQNTTAYDILSTQIAAGNPPDIIGPVGFRGFYSYRRPAARPAAVHREDRATT